MRLAALLLIAASLSAQAAWADSDPFIGAWTMNPKASSYQSGDFPASTVIVMQQTPEGIQYQSRTIQSDHRTTTAKYTAAYDGQQALVLGDAGFLTPVKLQRIDAHTVDASYVRGLKVLASSRRVVSADGARMTITTTFKDKDGKLVTNVGVYQKSQEPETALNAGER